MRLGKKLKSGLKLGAKIAGGALAVGAGLFALGSKATPSTSTPSQDFMGGRGSIADVPTDQLDSLFPVAGGGTRFSGEPVIKRTQPRQESTESIIRRRANDVPEGFIPPPTGPALIIN